jgi:hypothetical protein
MPILLALMLAAMLSPAARAAAADEPGRTLYVSKLGDGSDGGSWSRAFTTIQAALSAVGDDRGGSRIIVRPDTYFEAMLSPGGKGAPGRYNELIGDTDGRFGSGTTGSVVIDSSDPGLKGFKSYDWWGPIRANAQGWSPAHKDATFSAIGWDRWRLAWLYVTGGDGGIFFDLTDQVKPFTVVVEDCVAIGRAFGGGVASCLARPDEPVTFRRCHLWALDFWGDTAGAYCRVENAAMPERPDIVFEDCIMAGPQCSLKAGNFGFHTYTHVRVSRCRLVTLNFSQPQGTPVDGIIQSVQEGKYLRVDLEDSVLMGYKAFGVIVKKETVGDIGYSVKGDVKAYVQFQQNLPKGMTRLASWPVDVFGAIAPAAPVRRSPFVDRELVQRDMCEVAPFSWRGQAGLLECVRPASGGSAKDYYLRLRDAKTGEEWGRLAEGYGLASIFVHDGTAHVFASRWEPGGWRDVTAFRSRDLRHWELEVVVRGENEGLFNSSVCEGPDGFVMAYESDDPRYPAFTIKFARSKDLKTWTKLPEATFGTDRYTACPCVRFAGGYYYVLYLERREPRWFFETYITRSRDLWHWERSAANPVLAPEGLDEGINASDPELAEENGRTVVYFSVGDQLSWMNIKRAVFPGRLKEFLESWYRTPGIPDRGSLGADKTAQIR